MNNKTGVSQRKIASMLGVSQPAISKNLKKMDIGYYKRQRAPKANEKQILKQADCLKELCKAGGLFSYEDNRDILLDDESWFTPDGAGMPGNSGFYSNDRSKTPHKIKFRTDSTI